MTPRFLVKIMVCIAWMLSISASVAAVPVLHFSWEGGWMDASVGKSLVHAVGLSGLVGRYEVGQDAFLTSPRDLSDDLLEGVAIELDAAARWRVGAEARWLPIQKAHAFNYSYSTQRLTDQIDETVYCQSLSMLGEYILYVPNEDDGVLIEGSLAAGPAYQLVRVTSAVTNLQNYGNILRETAAHQRNILGAAGRVRVDWFVTDYASVDVAWEPVVTPHITIPSKTVGNVTLPRHELSMNYQTITVGLRFHVKL